MTTHTVFPARKIITMCESMPTATMVVVAEGRIVAVGPPDSLAGRLSRTDHVIDDRLADKVLMPGFIDPHVHPSLPAVLTQFPFIAPEDWVLPTGTFPAATTPDEYLTRLDALVAAHPDPATPMITWGYHPLWHGEITKESLSSRYPDQAVIAWHRSFHEVYVNDAAIAWLGITEDQFAGHPEADWARGHFWETAAQSLIGLSALPGLVFEPGRYRAGMAHFFEMLHLAGVTTCLDMGVGALSNADGEIALIRQAAESTDAPARLILTPLIIDFIARGLDPEAALMAAEEWAQQQTGRVTFDKHFKVMMDGAIFGGLSQYGPPGYLDGHHGMWMAPLEVTRRYAEVFWKAGYQIHAHTNGDLSADALIDLVRHLQVVQPRFDHRTVLEHFAYTTEDQNRQIAALDMVVSANPYYHHILSDSFSEHYLGPDRGAQMVRLGSLERLGVPFTLHSDCPMAPLSPLTLAWTACNRVTINGNLSCPEERISLHAALRAITIDAAWVLRKENDIGSIRAGKLADFAVLEDDPYEVGAEGLKDIRVWGVVFEGVVRPVER